MAFINCPECNTTISDKAISCPHCGAPTNTQQASAPQDNRGYQPLQDNTGYRPAQGQQPVGQPSNDVPPKTWLVESILATIFCCLPFGVVGIMYAAKVESNWASGSKELARSAARSAKNWTLASIFSGLGVVIIYFIMLAMGLVAGIFSEGYGSYY